jgi:hypothetical protein
MEVIIQNGLRHDMFNKDSSQILEYVGDYCNNIIPVHAIIRFARFIGIEMNRHFCTTSWLWRPISCSLNRVDLVFYWIEKNLKGISQLNNHNFVH